jgi:CDP-4-dehydro-6-deoxyglucose reductase, E3
VTTTNDLGMQANEAPYRVVESAQRTATILELWLRPLEAPLRYPPGRVRAARGQRSRDRSALVLIANAPRSDGLISLLVTRVPDGLTSTWIHEHLRVGDDVSLSGPYGTFVDDTASDRPCLFLAAGSGLAPMRSLIEAALSTGARRSLTLVVSARTEADVIDRERFTGWQASHPHLRYLRTLTRAEGPGLHGRIPAVLPSVCDELVHQEAFIAGSPGFAIACAAALEKSGLCLAHIHTEPFVADPG